MQELFSINPEWVSRVTKVTLFHLNGETSEMKLITPIFSMWGEPQELSYSYLTEYVNGLTACWIAISGYQVSLGSIDKKGEERYSIDYPTFEIPLNKVYHGGQWVDPVTDEIRDRSGNPTRISILNNYLSDVEAGRASF